MKYDEYIKLRSHCIEVCLAYLKMFVGLVDKFKTLDDFNELDEDIVGMEESAIDAAKESLEAFKFIKFGFDLINAIQKEEDKEESEDD